jgi:hypothetical protein
MSGSLLLVALFSSCSAQSYHIQKASAFLTVSVPGTVMVDDKGNQVPPKLITERSVFIETNYKGKPKIDSVLYNGILFTSSVADKETTSLHIGIRKDNEQPVKLTKKKGNHIWQIYLQSPADHDITYAVKKIVVIGKLDKKVFRYSINAETELSALPRY